MSAYTTKMLKWILAGIIFIISYNLYAKEVDEECEDMLIETIGKLSSSNLYQTFISLTLIKENLDNEEFYENYEEMIYIIEGQLEMNIEHLSEFNKCKLFTKEDFELLFKIKEVYYALKDDAKHLKLYIFSGLEQDYESFIETHRLVSKKLDEIISDIGGFGRDNND